MNKIQKVSTIAIALFALAACQQSSDSSTNDKSASQEQSSNKATELKQESKLKKVTPPVATSPTKSVDMEKKPMKKILPYKGTIHYYDLEGGFFGITTHKGLKLLPMGLGKEFMQHGAEIEFSGQIEKDVMTIQQWGTPFKINDINITKPGKPVSTGGKHETM